MEYKDAYQELFEYIKNHKYDEFIKKLELIDTDANITFDINIRDKQNNYLLTYAVSLNEPKLVKLLIKKGARIDIVDKSEKSVILITIAHSYYDIMQLLLEENRNNIGISIVDIRDKNLKTPLHFAIELQNFKAIKMLLDFGSNPNISDKDGYNSLHLAIKTRSYEICDLVIQYISDINARYNTGETALHIACNLQLVDIVKLLLKYNANVNIQDYSHEITAIHYSVLLNNKELISLLLKHGAEPNCQDVYGNSPVHYCIIENNFEIFLILSQSEYTKNIINFNMWNIDGEIPLHLALKNNIDSISDYLMILLEKSNLSIQDNMGNTCLHYLIKLNLWQDYDAILIKKRLDIFIKNVNGESPIDLLSKDDIDKFLDIVTDSYIYRLKSAGELWHDEWENICSKSFNNITEDEINTISSKKRSLTTETFDLTCKDLIKKKISAMILSKSELTCYQKSYPVRKSLMCVNLLEGAKIDYCTFTGTTLDILIGLIFLLSKHKNTCSTLSKNFAQNKNLCAFYKSIGIIMNTTCEFLNFEIVWVHQKLYMIDDFYDKIKRCLSNPTKKFIIIPIGIEMREGSHAGYLIYDIKANEVERFEPHGSTAPPGLYYNPDLLDELLYTRLKGINENIKYIKPKDFLPKIGFQLLDVNENKKKKIGDPTGFCALWCIWYVDMRLTYQDFDRHKLVKALIKSLKSKNISFKNMIRNYSENIIKIRDKILLNSKMDINDWLNDQYTDVQINTVMEQLINEIQKIGYK